MHADGEGCGYEPIFGLLVNILRQGSLMSPSHSTESSYQRSGGSACSQCSLEDADMAMEVNPQGYISICLLFYEFLTAILLGP